MKYISTLFLLFLMFASTQLLSAPAKWTKEFLEATTAFKELRQENKICVVNDSLNVVNKETLYQVKNWEDFDHFCKKFIDVDTTRFNQSSAKRKFDDFMVAKYNPRRKKPNSNTALRTLKIFFFWKELSGEGPNPIYCWFPYPSLPIFNVEDLNILENIGSGHSNEATDTVENNASEESEESDFEEEAAEQDSSMIDYPARFSAVNNDASFSMQLSYPPLTVVEQAPLQILPEDENLFDLVNLIEIASSGRSGVANNEDLPLALQKFLMTFFPWLDAKASLRGYSTTGEVYELKVFAVDHEDPWAVLTLKLTDSEMPNTLAITFFQKPTLRGPLNFGETPCIDVDDSYPLFIKQGMLLFSRKNISLEELRSRYLKNTNLISTSHDAKGFSMYVTIAQSRRLIEIHGDTPKFGRQFNIYISSCRVNGKETELYE